MQSRIRLCGMVVAMVAGLWLAGYPALAAADAEADYKLGQEAFKGSDLGTAMVTLRRASEAGHIQAMVMLGYVLDIAEEDAEAVRWYRRAAEKGSAEGALGLGVMIGKGEGIPKNEAEALKWITKSAESGHGPAIVILADVYRNGDMGEKIDKAKALMWLHKGVDINYTPAIIELAQAYRKGSIGLTANMEEAERLEKMLPKTTPTVAAKPPAARGKVRQ